MFHTHSERSFFKDLQELYKKIDTSTEGQGSIIYVDDMTVMVALQPKSGLYAHAVFHITVSLFSIALDEIFSLF